MTIKLASVVALTSVALSCSTSVFAEQISEQTLINSVATSIDYSDKHGTDIWPGYKPKNLATVFIYDPNGTYPHNVSQYHLYAFDFTSKNLQWQKMNIQGKEAYYMPQNPFGIEGSEEDLLKLDGQYVLSYQSSNRDDATEVAVDLNQERFVHFYEQQLNDFNPGPLTFFKNENNLKWALLEVEALKGYLQNNDIDSLKNALAIRQYRAQFMNDEAKRYDILSEKLGGIILYASLKSANLDPQKENAYLTDRLLNDLPKISDEDRMFFDDLEQYSENAIGYYSGAVIGLALDRSGDTQWKSSLEKNALASLLMSHYPMNQAEINQRAEAATQKYHFEDFSKKMDSAFAANDAGIIALQNQFATSHDVSVTLSLRVNDKYLDLNASMQHEYPVSSDEHAYDQITRTVKWDDVKFSLQYTNLPIVFETTSVKKINASDDQSIKVEHESTDQFKLSADTHLVIDGKETTLGALVQTDQTIHFHQLSIDNANAQMTIGQSKKGELITKQGSLQVNALIK